MLTAGECVGSRQHTALTDYVGDGQARCRCGYIVRVTIDGRAIPHQPKSTSQEATP